MAVLGWRIWARWWVFACYSFSSLRALLHPRHCESLSPRHCEERSDEAISSNAPPRHCEPKGRQVCWREAISSLHVPVGVKCSEEIASPDCYQARNDEKEVFARNDVVGCVMARHEAIPLFSIFLPNF